MEQVATIFHYNKLAKLVDEVPEHFYRCELAISNQHAQVGARRGAGVRHPVRSLLRLAEIARYLASQYERLTVLRFPDCEYERFKQVLLLVKRREKNNVPTNEEIESIQRLAAHDLRRTFAKLAHKGGLRAASDNFSTKREIIEALDVTATISVENGEQVVYAQCVLGEKVISVTINHDS